VSAPNDARTLWAWVTALDDGSVSQVGALVGGMHLSLIGRDRAVVESFRPLAQAHGERTGQRVWLREYRDVVDHGDA
jgi:hypothetical protein